MVGTGATTRGKASPRRFLALALPFLPTDRLARLRWGTGWRAAGRPEAPPLAVAGRRDNAVRLVALDETAARHGLHSGQGLADARAILPALDVVEEDQAADRLLLEAVADWCDRYTPLVALDAPDGMILDITGCARLFGGEAALLKDLLGRVFHQGFDAAGAVAATPGAAWALARFRSGRAGSEVLRSDETMAALGPLPLAALRLDGETLSGLARLGLHTVGQVMARPRAPLARRFGRLPLLRLDQALGAVDEALSPRRPVPALTAERRLAEPVGLMDDIERLALRLAGHVCADLERRGEGARRFELALWRVDGHVARLAAGTSRPLRDPAAMLRLLAERFAALGDDFDAGYGFDMARLAVLAAERLDIADASFLGGSDPGAAFGLVMDRLAARLGPERVLTGRAVDTHPPEAAEALAPAVAADGVAGQAPDARELPAGMPPTRPLRLLARPEPVEAMAAIPDGPPLRFRWRRMLHEIIRAEGPERIAGQWWRRDAVAGGAETRDYYRVEDRQGRRFWLYREGFYVGAAAPRWYLHGLFA